MIWNMPVTWEMCAYINVNAATLEEAMEIARDKDGAVPLPADGDYVDGSWCLSSEDEDYLLSLQTEEVAAATKSKGEFMMIVKIQRSIFPPGANTMLIYDRKHSVEGQLPLTNEVKKLLAGDLKGYFQAKLDSTGLLHIQQRVADQEW